MGVLKSTPLTPPLPWWRLPFALALASHGVIGTRCHLCRLYPRGSSKTLEPASGGHLHWFNQIAYLCADCHAAIGWEGANFRLDITHPILTTTLTGLASTNYQLPYAQCMRDFKNHNQFHRLGVLVHAVRQLTRPLGCHTHNSAILAIPSSQERLLARGFDPVQILAKYLSFHWQIPLYTGIERQARRHQQGLSRDDRLQNVSGSFRISEVAPIKHVIVFDDVVTTGATLQAATEALLATFSATTHPYPLPCIHPRGVLHG